MECIPKAGTATNQRFPGCNIQSNVPETDSPTEDNPDGINLTEATKEISARWRLLSKEDRVAITTRCMQQLEEEREVKVLTMHNVPLRAFHDARSTVQHVEKEVSGTFLYL
jgi:hypothetical protein